MATTPIYALPYQALTDAPNGPTLGSALATAVEAQIARLDAALATIAAQQPVSATEATAQTGVTSLTPAEGTPVCGLTFVFPPSGKCYLTVTGFLESTGTSTLLQLGWELRTGASIGAGTLVTAPSQVNASMTGKDGSPTTANNASWRDVITGTPGASYNVRTMHWSEGTSPNGTVWQRKLLIEPVH